MIYRENDRENNASCRLFNEKNKKKDSDSSIIVFNLVRTNRIQ